jgi:glycine cleavage system aminomethyltransferase T
MAGQISITYHPRDFPANSKEACHMTSNSAAPSISIGPRVRKSPYFDATLRHGARAFTVYNHMFMPTCYTSPVEEYWSLVKGVTLWDVSCQRQIEITGPDALGFTQLLTPRDLSNCKAGQCLYVLITDEDGGIVNDAVLLVLGPQRFWLSPGDGDILLWTLGVAVNSGMDVSIVEPDVSPLQLQGPKSPQVAQALFGDSILDLKYYWLLETELDGIPLVISRTGWSGELGYEIYLQDGRQGENLWEKVMSAGEPYEIKPIAPNLIRSIEGALLSHGSDITLEDDPYTLGLGRLVNLDKEGGFIGQQALKQIQATGPRRRLVGVELQCAPLRELNHEPWPVAFKGETVGRISRCIHSPRLDRNIGFANVPAELSEPGQRLDVSTPGGVVEAIVVSLPWFPAEKIIPPAH